MVVFCDLRGFTAFARAADPDAIMELLRGYHEALGEIVTAYQATLIAFLGDGVMLLLNAPLPCAEPALQAVRMAHDLQAAMRREIAAWAARGHAIGFGIGLAKGSATVGRIGYEGRQDYAAIGSVTNLASRLCALAGDGQVLVDAAAAAELDGRLPLVALGPHPLKGFGEPVPVYAAAVTPP